jgi:photosystem II stability/assembly factor-like uncharacterized protein
VALPAESVKTETPQDNNTMRRHIIIAALLLAAPARAADWEPVCADLIAREKPGFGGLCGVVVDRSTGALTIDLSARGLYRSDDRGKSWQKLHRADLKGRTETPGCMQFDPTGKSKRLLVPLVYGAPISVFDGDAVRTMDRKASHVDWAAVDWSDPEMKFVLTLKHESGGVLLLSRDGGKSFDEAGKGHGPAWVFDGQTAVVAEMKTREKPRPNLLRTTDGGKTWQPCGVYSATALPRPSGRELFWLVEGALVKTADKGENWQKVCDLPGGRFGPVFGKDARHLFVLTDKGIVESTDGGLSWANPLPLPQKLGGAGGLTWLDYDATGDVLYIMKMGSDLYRLSRK